MGAGISRTNCQILLPAAAVAWREHNNWLNRSSVSFFPTYLSLLSLAPQQLEVDAHRRIPGLGNLSRKKKDLLTDRQRCDSRRVRESWHARINIINEGIRMSDFRRCPSFLGDKQEAILSNRPASNETISSKSRSARKASIRKITTFEKKSELLKISEKPETTFFWFKAEAEAENKTQIDLEAKTCRNQPSASQS